MLARSQPQPLEQMHPAVASWFRDVFAGPTPIQVAAWTKILQGEHTLLVAPTGSGKTLASFLVAISRLVSAHAKAAPAPASQGRKRQPARKVKVIYVSPLKALGVDVERNLQAPLTGIALKDPAAAQIKVAVRSGDTPQAERQRFLKQGADILITTPESLFLLLTSKAAAVLDSVETIIVDEIHAVAGSKRGVHLALSLERLDQLVGRDVQRIGCSATVSPIETVSQFLGGDRPVAVIDPPIAKDFELQVVVNADFADLPASEISNNEVALPVTRSIWPSIEEDLLQRLEKVRSTIVFVNSRSLAERLTARLNELATAASADAEQPVVVAKAHHGSVAKAQRQLIETQLKQGELPCVVATSSLELGIDMGAVDQVLQVEAPPSVASGLQRLGRAGHFLGAKSFGVIYPKHAADLITTTATAQAMLAGEIEPLHVPEGALDVLVQQTIAAAVAAGEEGLSITSWFAAVRRSFPYRGLTADVTQTVVDLVTGLYPATDFADLKPLLREEAGLLFARPGARKTVVTNAGTIPDRGLFGVFLPAGAAEAGARRVGELDEEMVYESRVGDVITLGASSWKIEEITRDQVIVTPAPGQPGRLPFWVGDGPHRPFALGQKIGQFRRKVAQSGFAPDQLPGWLSPQAKTNLVEFLQAQQEATGVIPDEKTLVLERYQDELGDWRVVLHTPFGRSVNLALAAAISARVEVEQGVDPNAVAGDDGIVLRLPDRLDDQGLSLVPSAQLLQFTPAEAQELVTERVGNTALFAARFRECAARALLLPKRNPGARSPLWQQRLKAQQLLDVARKYPSFPLMLEAARECLQDEYDLPATSQVLQDLAAGKITVREVTTTGPSPFAAALLFSYSGNFMYEGDAPAAERRAATLSLDPQLLAQLLGSGELSGVFDEQQAQLLAAQLAKTAPGYQVKTAAGLVNALRELGPQPIVRLPQMLDPAAPPLSELLQEREAASSIMQVQVGGATHLALTQEAALLRDALGIPVPPGVAAGEMVADALPQLLRRFLRTHVFTTPAELAAAFGLGPAVVLPFLASQVAAGTVVAGLFTPTAQTKQYAIPEILEKLRQRQLAAARKEIAPVAPAVFAQFVAARQLQPNFGPGADGLYAVIEQLGGVKAPVKDWLEHIFPARLPDFDFSHLAELLASGEVVFVGSGSPSDLWGTWLTPDQLAAFDLAAVPEDLSPLATQLLAQLEPGGSFLFSQLSRDLAAPLPAAAATLWQLVACGLVTPDHLPALTAQVLGSNGRTTSSRRRLAAQLPHTTGRWQLLAARRGAAPTPEARATEQMRQLLERYGVVSKAVVAAEKIPGGFTPIYQALSTAEQAGKVIRGLIVAGGGAAQFASSPTIDQLRATGRDEAGPPLLLAATDPAQLYGAVLPWPEAAAGRFSRTTGALCLLNAGELLAYVTRSGNLLLVRPDLEAEVPALLCQLAPARGLTTIKQIAGEYAPSQPLAAAFLAAGATVTPSGLRLPQPGRQSQSARRLERDAGVGITRYSSTRRGRSLDSALAQMQEQPAPPARPRISFGNPQQGQE